MSTEGRTRNATLLIVAAALMIPLLIGVGARLAEPLSSPVVPAEDPYTHMALVKEHLRDGSVEPIYEGGGLYPPGLHGFLAATWVYSGADLYDIFLYGPVAFGAIAVLGIALLLGRSEGAVAAFVGALAVALAPEHIFRTTMMAPTAMDLAILPFFLFTAIEMLRGRLEWTPVAAIMTLFFVVAHPWVIAIMAPAAVGLAVLALVLPWARSRSAPMSPVGAAALLLVLSAGLAMTLFACWDACAAGFQAIQAPSLAASLDMMSMLVAAVAATVAGLLFLFRGRLAAMRRRRPRLPVQLLFSGLILAGILAVTFLALAIGMPEHVDLPRMLGWPLLLLAAVGAVALPFLRSPVAHAGAALSIVTYPFVVLNPFQSEFWPHRTAVFLGVGLAILAGVTAAAAARGIGRLGHAAVNHGRSPRALRKVRPTFVALAISFLVATGIGGTVYAATPEAYDKGWYRLFPECEFDQLRELAGQTGPEAVLVTGTWQAKLVAAPFADRAEDTWFMESFFYSEDKREETIAGLAKEGRGVIVVIDRHVEMENPELPTGFLEGGEWEQVGAWCDQGTAKPRLVAYATGVRP